MNTDTQTTVWNPSAARAGLAAVGMLVLAACASVSAEDACLKAGYASGTAAFDQCVADKRKNAHRGARGWGGPGGGGL